MKVSESASRSQWSAVLILENVEKYANRPGSFHAVTFLFIKNQLTAIKIMEPFYLPFAFVLHL